MSFYVQVALPLPLDRKFLYSIFPKDPIEVRIGSRVLVPFGKRTLTGVIVGIRKGPPPKNVKIKEVFEVLDHSPLFSKKFLTFTRQLSEYHHSSWGELLLGSSPPSFAPKSRTVLSLVEESRDRISDAEFSGSEKELLVYLQRKNYTIGYLKRQIGEAGFAGIVSRLEKRNFIQVIREVKKSVQRIKKTESATPAQLEMDFLQDELKDLSTKVAAELKRGDFSPCLFYGPAKSREAIYFHLIRNALAAGKSVLFLVPEISLMERLVERLQKKLEDKAVVFHSQLSERERESAWEEISAEKARVVIGPRSALLLPMRNIGLILMDSEHDESYYQTENPVFDARKGAWIRAKVDSSVLVFGSEFPSVELYYRAEKDRYLFPLPQEKRLQQISIVDSRRQGEAISFPVQKKITESLKKKRPVFVFLNRRGYASYILCSRCSHIFRCKKCQIPLSYHKREQTLVCHYCNVSLPLLKYCPECGNDVIKKKGIGIEVLQEEMKRVFPYAKIERFDSDVIESDTDRKKVFSRLENSRIDILIGTQLLIRQQEIPLTSLAIVFYPEMLLTLPDFRANRKAFQSLDSIFGCLHNSKDSELVIETALPEYFKSFQSDKGSYKGFFEQDIQFRQLMGYPPFSCLIEILLASDSLRTLARECRRLRSGLQIPAQKGEILGPSLAPLLKIRGKHRAQVILKTRKLDPLIQENVKEALSQVRIPKKVFVYE